MTADASAPTEPIDRLSGLLRHFHVSAQMFHSGPLCGVTPFYDGPQLGHLHVLQQAPAPARWQLGAGVTHLGRSSMVMRVAFFKDDAVCAAYADCVLVFVNRERGVPVAMPELIRTLLDQRRVNA